MKLFYTLVELANISSRDGIYINIDNYFYRYLLITLSINQSILKFDILNANVNKLLIHRLSHKKNCTTIE